MEIGILPKSLLGKWSIGLIIALVASLGLFFLFIAFGQRGGENFFSNLYLAIPAVCMGVTGISAFFTSIIGIIKDKDYSVLIFVSAIIGFFVLFWVLAEIFFPH
ncbi:MAG: hypothetical protein ACTSWY_04830 [Promethearchaeota archaeon]